MNLAFFERVSVRVNQVVSWFLFIPLHLMFIYCFGSIIASRIKECVPQRRVAPTGG